MVQMVVGEEEEPGRGLEEGNKAPGLPGEARVHQKVPLLQGTR